MKKEFYKLSISPLAKVCILFTFICIFALTIYNSFSTKKPAKNIYDQGIILAEYKTVDDVSRHLEITKRQLNELEPTVLNYEREKNTLEYRIKLYEYLQVNFIEYKNLVDLNIISYSPTENFYSFHARTIGMLMYLVIIVLIILNYVIFSIDFDNSSYKYIYVKGNRSRMLLKKTILIFINMFIVVFSLCLIVTIYSFILYLNEPQYIIFFINGDVKVIEREMFVLLDSLSALFYSFTMCLLITGIFIIFKKTIYSIFVFALYFMCTFFIPSMTTNYYLMELFILPIFTTFDKALWVNLTFKVVFSSIVYAFGFVKFLRDDL